MDDDRNVLHLFRDITKQILTVSLDQRLQIMPGSCAMLLSAPVNILISDVVLGLGP